MINSNFGFTPLKELWLGNCYPEHFYDHLPNEIADPFKLITEQTEEDTGRLQRFLEERGIIVRRPVFDSIDTYIDGHGNLVKPPVTPRDHYLTLGNTLYSLHNDIKTDPWRHWLTDYATNGFNVQVPVDQPINCLYPPSLVRIGRDIYLDTETHKDTWGFITEWMVEQAKTHRINICNTNGHSDAVFTPVAPGVLVTSHYKQDYTESFPGWDIYRVPVNLNNSAFIKKHKHWFLGNDTIDSNQTFNQHVLTAAANWVGDYSETVYEVNMLVLDEHNVVAMKEYPPLFEWLSKKGINVHLFELRTRGFWDGGWHCFTLDIHRDDTALDLFPERGSNGVYWRLN
jgi:hypothetical protein